MADEKPCGEFHPLPCGLDVDCPVDVEYHSADMTDEEVVERWDSNDG